MNKIIKSQLNNTTTYTLVCEDNSTYECTRWYERKTGKWHIRMPKDNPSGREFLYESKLDNIDVYEFASKTEHRTDMVYTNNWRARLTESELEQLKAAEDFIAKLKADAMTRKPKELTEEEKLQREIEKLQAKLASLRG